MTEFPGRTYPKPEKGYVHNSKQRGIHHYILLFCFISVIAVGVYLLSGIVTHTITPDQFGPSLGVGLLVIFLGSYGIIRLEWF